MCLYKMAVVSGEGTGCQLMYILAHILRMSICFLDKSPSQEHRLLMKFLHAQMSALYYFILMSVGVQVIPRSSVACCMRSEVVKCLANVLSQTEHIGTVWYLS